MRGRRSISWVGWIVAAALLALGCETVSPLPGPTRAEQAAYDVATADADPAAALERFLGEWPGGALEPQARVRLGEIAQAEGDVEGALSQWYRVIRDFSRSEAADTARVRAGVAEWGRGDTEAARSVLSRVRFGRLAPVLGRQAYRVLADAATDPVARVRWLALAREEELDDDAVDEIDAAIDTALSGMDERALARLGRQLGDRPPAARVWLARAERLLDAGDLDGAQQALEQVAGLPLPPRYGARLAGAAERLQVRTHGPSDISDLPSFEALADRPLPATQGASGTLGVVLPLTGPFARFGEESLHGVMLAVGVFGPDPDAPETAALRLVVRDSAGDAARAAAAVRELAQDESVTAIVGPLLSASCEAAAVAAQELGIPLLTLTAREEIAKLRSFVFRLRTRPVEEAQILVERARSLGAERFAILYRDDPYGLGLRGIFWDAVESRGGTIVGVAAYDPKATDFAEPIRKLVGYELISSEEKRLIREREGMLRRARRLPADEARALREDARSLLTDAGDPLPPIVDFDALFIAESHEKVVLIAPQLAFHEIFGPRLLGPDGWYHEDLVRLGREHVEGAVFVSHFFPESPTSFVRDFADRYQETYAHGSNVFAAQAYDAANLVLVQLARGFMSRESVRDGVLATEAYPGAAGVLTMRADGNANRRPFLLGVERGRIVQLE
jgi:ABC-type branched-subunit amino acid transport system substrate-binding protein